MKIHGIFPKTTAGFAALLAACLIFACGDDGGNGNGRPADTRIPGYLSDDGIDLFAAEGDQVLGLT